MTDINNKMRAPQAAAYTRVAESTLAKLRCYGGGPRFAKLGPRLEGIFEIAAGTDRGFGGGQGLPRRQ